jgi:protein TonB
VVAPVKPVIAPSPAATPKPEAVKPAVPVPVITPVGSKPAPVVTPVSQVSAPPVAPAKTVIAKTDALPASLAAQLSSLLGPRAGEATSGAHVQAFGSEVASPAVAKPPTEASAEELRQQAARLQEQLSSLLFRDSTQEKAATPVAPPTPVVATPVVPAPITPNIAVPAKPVTHVETEKAPVVLLPAAAETKVAPVLSKQATISLPVEEVKIPSWLAPLARETETAAQTPAAAEANSARAAEESSYESSGELSSGVGGISSQNPEPVLFGGQLLLGGSEATEAQGASSGSKKGLWIGLAAAALLAIAGGAWYGLQPGNFLAASSASTPTAATAPLNTLAGNGAAPKTTVAAAAITPNSATPATNSPATAGRPVGNSAASVPPVETVRTPAPVAAPEPKVLNTVSKSVTSATAVEQPKKQALGNVRLATPNVNRSANSASDEAAPSIDAAETTSAGDPLAGLAVTHGRQPSAPLPIGGDVKAAHLLKSTPPLYPATARSQRISGDVQLDALIDATGNVTTTKVISGPTLLHQAAITAVKQWKYEPAQLDGKPTAMHLTVTVQFRLQ